MIDDARGDENDSSSEEIANPPKVKKSRTWIRREIIESIKLEYLRGGKSIRECCLPYGVNYRSVETKAFREGWCIINEPQKIVERVESRLLLRQKRLEDHEERMIQRMEERLVSVDKTIAQVHDLQDPSDLKAIVSTESTIDQVIRRSLGAQDKLDVTSGGKSLSENVLDVLQKVRSLNREGAPVIDVETLKLAVGGLSE